MHRSSLRTWLLLISVLFALLVVGGMAITTYVVVSDGMSVVARETALKVAENATEILAEVARETADDIDSEDGVPATEGPAVRDQHVEEMIGLLGYSGLSQAEFAYYNADLEPVWDTDERVLTDELDDQRTSALQSGQSTESLFDAGGLLDGLVGPAHLGVYIVHIPLESLGMGSGVLDVAYFPDREEEVIDDIRSPMSVMAVVAMLIMVLMMQTSMSWVLKLVDDLRKAADSVDAGDLDVRLPEEGDHEIGDLARSLNRLIDRLKRRADAQTRFVADASHELATPVAGIRGYTNILRAWGGDDPEVREEAISAIDRESRRMARLCGDLLSLVRDERAVEYRSIRFDLNARCREILAAAATRYIEKGLEFIGPEEGQLIIVGDPDRIEDAISILVDNAAKYTEAGTVTVQTRRKRDSVIVEIADTGMGIPAEDLPNIFDRFYRSDLSRSQMTGGFGLGLPIAKSIIDSAKGTIEVSSAVDEGTLFVLRFPRGRA